MKKKLILIFCILFSVVAHSQNSACEQLKDAIIQGDINKFKKIMRTKIDVNCVSKNESTPLGIACSRGNIEFVKSLLKNNANPNIPIYYDEDPLGTALFDALRFCEQILEPKLIDVAKINSKTKKKVEKCNNETKDDIVRLLLKNGANAKFIDSNKTTLLMIASMYNRHSVLKLLIDEGADINAQNSFGNSALIYAIINNDYSSAKILIDSGANISLKDKEGKTAFEIAKESKLVDILQLFKK